MPQALRDAYALALCDLAVAVKHDALADAIKDEKRPAKRAMLERLRQEGVALRACLVQPFVDAALHGRRDVSPLALDKFGVMGVFQESCSWLWVTSFTGSQCVPHACMHKWKALSMTGTTVQDHDQACCTALTGVHSPCSGLDALHLCRAGLQQW